MEREMNLEGKVALVTGGSSGIGAETVKLLAKNGCRVIVGYNKGTSRAKNLINTLPKSGHAMAKIELGNESSILEAELMVRQEYGKRDFLINSAGYTEPILHSDTSYLTSEKFNLIINTNAGGTYSVIRAFIPVLSVPKFATIVNVSSVSAFTGSGSNIAYCAAKAAIDTMTISLARVLGPKIRVLCVSPAAVDTGFVNGRSRKQLQDIASKTPLQRVIEPQDISLTILACLTHLKSSTGTKIIVDGGHHIK